MWRWQWRWLRKLHERSPSSATRLSRAQNRTPKHTCISDFQRYRHGGGLPKFRDSFFGDMAMAVAAVFGDLGLGFD
ncbi:hypothetical protein TIFTF001_021004 [Ficus carica]|uniref:Uncharacterized protein n=1 Tax=Ficus carica TaxID=3494 RepID=A0AA88DJQ2_FICCA|nr:hypothetical protein TIFTF001_021004 [Ficus carica]